MLDAAPARDWSVFNGLSLVDVIDRLYADQLENESKRHVNRWFPEPVVQPSYRTGKEWWAVYCPTANEGIRLLAGLDARKFDTERRDVLAKCFAPLLGALRSGEVVVEADGDHDNDFASVRVPEGFWRVAQWILYRHVAKPDGPQLVAVQSVSTSGETIVVREIGQKYFNPHLILPVSGEYLSPEPSRIEAGSPRTEFGGTPEAETAATPPADGSVAKPKTAPRVAPQTRNWTATQIREEARVLYKEFTGDPPNIDLAEKLLRKRLPGATRTRIRPVLSEPEFVNSRRRSGEKRNK